MATCCKCRGVARVGQRTCGRCHARLMRGYRRRAAGARGRERSMALSRLLAPDRLQCRYEQGQIQLAWRAMRAEARRLGCVLGPMEEREQYDMQRDQVHRWVVADLTPVKEA